MSSPRVTVIVTAYNQEAFIGPAIESVTAQDYQNLEILACDDASTDGTREVLNQWSQRDGRVRVIGSEHNTGLSENRNRGLRGRTGEFVALLDGDDLMRPGKISAQVRALAAEPTAAGCLHDADIFDSETGERLGLFSRRAGARGLREGGAELWLDPTYMVLPSTMMFRSRCIPSHLFETRLTFTADWLFCIEVFRQGRCLVLDQVYVDYRRHGAQMTSDSATKGFEEGLMVMALVDARYPELNPRTQTMRAALLYGEARRRVRSSEPALAVSYARAAARAGGAAAHMRLIGALVRSRWGRPAARAAIDQTNA
jgi:glycosyltransferase involved in cell wall biosynthesis